jgi:GNAT superfamily N-acetyltransferase
MGEMHPDEPHWYLPLIGTDPLHQGQGYGARLMSKTLSLCDQQQLPAYLEATNPRTIPFYQRFGFEVKAQIRCGECPLITTMWRAPRSTAFDAELK